MSEENYDQILEKTISEIKEEIKNREDVDLEKLKELEKEGKDRKTLKDWIDSRLEESEEGEKDEDTEEASDEEEQVEENEEESEAPEQVEKTPGGYQSTWEKPYINIILGIIIGVAVTALVMYPADTMRAQAEYTPEEVNSMVEEFVAQQLGEEEIDVAVASIDQDTYEDLYVVSLSIDEAPDDQTIDVYVSKRSGLMFMGGLAGVQPFDLESGEQIGMWE